MDTRERPEPKENEILVKVVANSINAAELHLIMGDPLPARLMTRGLMRPGAQYPGADFSGIVEKVGSKVKSFQVGDEVFGDMTNHSWGAFADYLCIPETGCVMKKPSTFNHCQSSCLPIAGSTGLKGIEEIGQVKQGDKVLVVGGSSGIGVFAIQIAKALGAHVTATATAMKVSILSFVGADISVDSSAIDITKVEQKFDVIFDAAGFRPFRDYENILAETGKYLFAGGGRFLPILVHSLMPHSNKGKTYRSFLATANLKTLKRLVELAEAGKLKPYVDAEFSLSDISSAFAHLEERKVKGKVVIIRP